MFSAAISLQPSYAQSDSTILLQKIKANSLRNKTQLTRGEFRYITKTWNATTNVRTGHTYYFVFHKDKFYTHTEDDPKNYVVQDGSKLYTVALEPEVGNPEKFVKKVNVSHMEMSNAIKAHGLLIDKQDVSEALPGFSHPKPGKDPKWGAYIQVVVPSEFKGDKVLDRYKISEEGLVFSHEEEIKRGKEQYIVRTKLLEVDRKNGAIIPIRSVLEKFAVDKGKETLTRRAEHQVASYRLGEVDKSLFVVEEKPGDYFENGDTGHSWKVGAGWSSSYSLFAGSWFVVMLGLPLWWIKRKLAS